MLVGNNELAITKKSGESLAILIAMQMRWYNAGCHLMEHIQGFTQSHWMPPSGECSHRIAAAAAMVEDFGRKHKTLTKNYF